MNNLKEVAVIDGVRTPFLRSNGAFSDLASHDLGRLAVQGLLKKTGIEPVLYLVGDEGFDLLSAGPKLHL